MASRPQLESDLGFQNPATLSARTYTLIAFNEFENAQAPGGIESAFVMQRCLHCLEPACVAACPTTALHRQDDGPVSYDEDECIGCRYCQLACPWDVPTSEWNSLAPKISKCTHCADRVAQPVPIAFNGQAVSDAENKRFTSSIETPACVKACPADALVYGTRDEMLAEAHKRIGERPGSLRRPRLRREGAGRHQRAVHLARAVREARLPDLRRETVHGFQQRPRSAPFRRP